MHSGPVQQADPQVEPGPAPVDGRALGTRTPTAPTPHERWSRPIGRRTVLTVLGLGALGTLFGSGVQSGITGALDAVHAQGVASLLPGGGGFTIYTVTGGYPAAPVDYRLQVGGLVRKPLALSVSDLRHLPATYLTSDFQCVTGWFVPNVHWVGVRLVDLAARAGALPQATAFEFRSFDGVYTESLTLAQARQSGAIVAYSMLGAPVTREHGGPVRLFVPDMFGYKSIKWLERIDLVTRPTPGYWEQNGYPINAWISGHPPARAVRA
jgi:hypothetical protein